MISISKSFIASLSLLFTALIVRGQNADYRLLKVESSDATTVTVHLASFGTDKKTITYEASCAALRLVTFRGVPQTRFSKPLLNGGEQTIIGEYPDYFEDLFTTRFSDFIPQTNAVTKFRKGQDKSTEYEVTVNVLQLRRDLEKNKILKHIGF